MSVLEKNVEQAFMTMLKSKRMYVCIKVNTTTETGWPDRLVLMPKGRAVFIEFKSEEGKASKKQKYIAGKLIDMGFSYGIFSDAYRAFQFVIDVATTGLPKACCGVANIAPIRRVVLRARVRKDKRNSVRHKKT